MYCLSIRQPWAHLILAGHKDIENRSWPTNARGKFIIHAGKHFDERFQKHPVPFIRQIHEHYGIELDLVEILDLPRGGLVGQAEIIDCVTESNSIWFEGPYGFVIKNAKSMPFRAATGFTFFYQEIEPYEWSNPHPARFGYQFQLFNLAGVARQL